MDKNKKQLTKEGFKKLKERYQKLSERIEQEKNNDDKLFMFRQEIEKIKKILKNAKIIKRHSNTEKVEMGSIVKVKQGGETDEFQIVDSIEANPAEGKISNESLVGEALMGHKIGDEVTVQSHIEITYKIIDIK